MMLEVGDVCLSFDVGSKIAKVDQRASFGKLYSCARAVARHRGWCQR